MAHWTPALPKIAYRTQGGLGYAQVYVATEDSIVPSTARIPLGFSTTYAPLARPRLRIPRTQQVTEIAMSHWGAANAGMILTTGLDSCVAIAVAAWHPQSGSLVRVAMAHLTGSYYPGGHGAIYTDGDWQKLFDAMPDDWPNGQLYALIAGSSHMGGWWADRSTYLTWHTGGLHSPTAASNPDQVYADLPKHIPRRNFFFYMLRPGLCNTMGFGINLTNGSFGEIVGN